MGRGWRARTGPVCQSGVVRYCFQCHREYDSDIEDCVECAVPLVDERPAALDDVGEPDEDQIAYELHEWSGQARQHLDQLLSGADLLHAWQGATLFVRASDEEAVDDLVDEVETTLLPTLDPDQEKVEYELDEWSEDKKDRLSDHLNQASIAHEFDVAGNLVVHAVDEGDVDEIVERVRTTEASDDEPDGTEVLEGVELHELLSSLFLSAGDLARNAVDHDAVLRIHADGERLLDVRTPFGFDSGHWRALRARVDDVIEVLTDEGLDDDDVTEAATALRDHLRPVV